MGSLTSTLLHHCQVTIVTLDMSIVQQRWTRKTRQVRHALDFPESWHDLNYSALIELYYKEELVKFHVHLAIIQLCKVHNFRITSEYKFLNSWNCLYLETVIYYLCLNPIRLTLHIWLPSLSLLQETKAIWSQ